MTLLFCESHIAEINPNAIVMRTIYSIYENSDLGNNFFVIALETRAMKIFEQKRYTEVCQMVLTNKAKLGIDSNFSIPNVKKRC